MLFTHDQDIFITSTLFHVVRDGQDSFTSGARNTNKANLVRKILLNVNKNNYKASLNYSIKLNKEYIL